MRMGQFFGLFLGLSALGVAVCLGIRGQPWVAALMGTGGLAGIIWAAVSGGRRSAQQDRPSTTKAHPPEEPVTG